MGDWATGQDDLGGGNDFAAADCGGAFETSDMAAALDATEDNQPEDKPRHVAPMQKEPPKLEGYPQAQKYDYDQFVHHAGDNYEWDGNATTYEWDGEEGDIGPEHPELEKILFGQGADDETGHGSEFSA